MLDRALSVGLYALAARMGRLLLPPPVRLPRLRLALLVPDVHVPGAKRVMTI